MEKYILKDFQLAMTHQDSLDDIPSLEYIMVRRSNLLSSDNLI